MNTQAVNKAHTGVIVPLVTPLTASGELDEGAVGRIVDFVAEGGVHGVFVLGTTGEGPSVPRAMRERMVRLTVECASGRMAVYAGISGEVLEDSVEASSRYFRAGVAAVVAHAPASYEEQPEQSLAYFAELAGRVEGDLVLYNMPLTTNVSLPIEVCKAAARKPRVIGIKDSENNAARLVELLRELGGQDTFSVLVGTGPLMAKGLLAGADGIVPSVGNLAPALCRQLYDVARTGKANEAERVHRRLMELSQVYQNGRTLDQSLAALKAAMGWLGLCGPAVFPPLQPLDRREQLGLRSELARLGLPVHDLNTDDYQANYRPHDGRCSGSWSRALPADPG
jgi:4-hydroxy-tetrahydrodipicolinate synthase